MCMLVFAMEASLTPGVLSLPLVRRYLLKGLQIKTRCSKTRVRWWCMTAKSGRSAAIGFFFRRLSPSSHDKITSYVKGGFSLEGSSTVGARETRSQKTKALNTEVLYKPVPVQMYSGDNLEGLFKQASRAQKPVILRSHEIDDPEDLKTRLLQYAKHNSVEYITVTGNKSTMKNCFGIGNTRIEHSFHIDGFSLTGSMRT